MTDVAETPGRIAVVDDEEALRGPVVDYLRMEGYDAVGASGGAELDGLMADGEIDLVILDVNMPGEDGFSIARRLRAAGPVGIIMLTAKSGLVDRVVGLEIGADDYLGKPFDPRELLARVRSVMRRLNAAAPDPSPAASEPAEPRPDYTTEFWVKSGAGVVRVPIDAVEWIQADKDYVFLHTRGRSHMMRITMLALEQRLDPEALLRVHRSAFVRPEAVAEVKRVGRTPTLQLKSGATVPVGPQYLHGLEARLGL